MQPELSPPPADEGVPPEPPSTRGQLSRTRAVVELLACSGFPTQIVIAGLLAGVGIDAGTDGQLRPRFVFLLSAIDTVVLIGLVCLLLRASGDRLRDVFLGTRAVGPELVTGALTLPLVFFVVVMTQYALRLIAPGLRNVEVSPFAPMLESPLLLAGFVLLVLVAGGIREELQRAFLLHRFEQRLGGGGMGVLVTSAAFGLGHTVQGWDAAIVTGMLGALWGSMYLARRSVAATVTNHALFNLTQIAVAYATRNVI